MGDREAMFFIDTLSQFDRATSARIMDDPEAFRLYHLAFFGFRGFEGGVEQISREEMPFYEIQFREYMRNVHGVEWRFDPEDWVLYRQIYTKEAVRV